MDGIDQIPALALVGDRQIATQIDYRTCERCGFHLMRIETTIISDQHLTVEHCPICEQFARENPKDANAVILPEDRLRQFDLWLGTHGLDRKTLESHYHLKAEHFFDNLT